MASRTKSAGETVEAEPSGQAPAKAKAKPKAKAPAKAKAKAAAKAPAKRASKAAAGGGGVLVVVESPAKAKTIKKYLGRGYDVKASVGHVKDLPKSKLGVDVEKDFAPDVRRHQGQGEGPRGHQERRPQRDARPARDRPRPRGRGDRLAHRRGARRRGRRRARPARPLQRDHQEARSRRPSSSPIDLDRKKFDAQQARRILDRLVGYKISPLLWKKVRRGLSAGRVQSVAVRLVVEREREIQAFVPEEYWSLEADLAASAAAGVPRASSSKVDGQKAELKERGWDAGARRRSCADGDAGRSRRWTARSGAATRRRRSSPPSCSRRRPTGSASPPRRR